MQDAEFDFSHIEPTSMFRGVMDFQLFNDAACFCWSKGLVERGELVCVQVIHHNDDPLCMGEMDVDQVTHTVSEVNHGSPLSHFDMSPRLQRRKENKEIADAVAFIFVIIFGYITRAWRQRQTSLLGQLFATLIKTDKQLPWIVWSVIEFQGIFHGTDEFSVLYLGNTPFVFQLRLKFVFFECLAHRLPRYARDYFHLNQTIC